MTAPKKYFVLILLLAWSGMKEVKAQLSEDVVAIQYFFDTDPGVGIMGNGAVMNVTPDDTLIQTFNWQIPGSLGTGLHHVYVRGKDEYGRWSIAGRQSFYVSNTTTGPNNIIAYQYYFDSDPGPGVPGNGAIVSVPATSSITETLNLNIPNNLAEGIHFLYMRGKETTGRWSLIGRQMFYVSSVANGPKNIIAYQYYFDTDPGPGNPGNGAIVSVPSTSSMTGTLNLMIPNNMSEGLHFLYVRGKDTVGRWSIIGRQMFYISSVADGPKNIIAYQYYFDTDPGPGNPGNGAIVSVPSTSSMTGTLNLMIPNNMSEGLHFLYVRGKDTVGRWSIIGRQMFYISSVADGPKNIIAYQYYFDSDPGVGFPGNGGIVAVTPTSDLNTALNLQIPNSLSKGPHLLYIRGKDDGGRWSNINRQYFYVSDVANGPHELTNLEYYFDSDPGLGNAYPYPGNVNGDINTTIFMGVTCLLPSTHYYYLRGKDTYGRWSIIERDTLNLLPGVAPSIVSPAGPLTLCLGDTFVLSALQIPGVAYRWLKNGVPIPGATSSTLLAYDTANYVLRAICSWDSSVSNTVMIIADHVSPVIICNSNPLRFTNPGICTYTISGAELDPLSVTDNCPDFTYWNTTTNTPTLNGGTLPLGPNLITWIVDDHHGQFDTCTSLITVEDHEVPHITCASNGVRFTDDGLCTYQMMGAEFQPISVADNCTAYTYSNNLNGTTSLNGVILPLGPNPITWTVNDGHGQTASCVVTVTVQDDEVPTITCPSSGVRQTDPGDCDYSVVGTEFNPTAVTDNCTSYFWYNSVNFLNTLNGVALPIGSNAIIWTVNDAHGNTASCTVAITVEDHESPQITCQASPVRNTNPGVCTYTVSGNELNPISVTDNCTNFTYWNTTNNLPTLNGVILALGPNLITWIVNDGHGQYDTCTSLITVEDHEVPQIVCANSAVRFTDQGVCTYEIQGAEFDPVSVSDNCTAYTYSNNSTNTSTLDGVLLSLGLNTITWTVNDGHGQTSSCVVNITVQDDESPAITCASNAMRNTDPGVCDYTIMGNEFNPISVSDNCTNYFYYNAINLTNTLNGVVLPFGPNNIVWTVNDGHGNTSTCTVSVSVMDNQVPSITCPPDVTLAISSAVCDTSYVYQPITADNCSGEMISLLSGIGSGNPFPVGIAQEVLQVEDIGENTAVCSFDITVIKIPDQVADTICYGDSLFLQGAYQYLPGIYNDTFPNQFDCDSFVITTLDTTIICIWPTDIVYVDSTATGENTGVSWQDAYVDLQLALDVGERYQNIQQVWMAEGTYFPTTGSNRSRSFVIIDSLIILGGFQGIENDSTSRNPDAYPVYLSGDIGIPENISDNSYHVVMNPDTSSGTRLDGVIILNGNANGPDTLDQSGAGLANYGRMVLRNSRIEQCESVGLGALLLNSGVSANLVLENVNMVGQSASFIWNRNLAELLIKGANNNLSD